MSTVTEEGRYVPSSPYNWIREGDVVCEAIGSHCAATVRSALCEAYRAGVAEGSADLLAALRRFVELYDDVRDSIGPSVRATLESAEAVIAKAEAASLLTPVTGPDPRD